MTTIDQVLSQLEHDKSPDYVRAGFNPWGRTRRVFDTLDWVQVYGSGGKFTHYMDEWGDFPEIADSPVGVKQLMASVIRLEDRVNALYSMLFTVLAEQWKKDTQPLSSVTAIASHPAYQQIIKMGRPALPLILDDLKTNLDNWFEALEAITRESPVDPDNLGDMELMRQAWLQWGRERGLVV